MNRAKMVMSVGEAFHAFQAFFFVFGSYFCCI